MSMSEQDYIDRLKYQHNLEEKIIEKIMMFRKNDEHDEEKLWSSIRYYFLQGCDKVNNRVD